MLRGCPQHGQRIAEAVCAVVKIAAEGRIFAGAVTGGQAENEAAAQQLVDAGRLLGDDQRIAQRQHDACGADGDVLCHRSQVAGVDQRIQKLTEVAEVWVVERDIA
ncbi:hypothetical protein D3C78_1251100 [compost metagenome]